MSSNEADEKKQDNRLLEGVGIHDIGQRLIDLGEQLVTIGHHTDSTKLRANIQQADEIGVDEVWDDVEREMISAVRRTLSGLSSFRTEYSKWERLTVEYALARRGFTQREVAQLLGVGLSTVNRWALNPLTHDQN